MIKIDEIRMLHIEFSSLCNARCPLCPRNLNGYPYNGGYNECNLSFDVVKNRFSPEFISQLGWILANGNFGDFLLNPKSLDIIRYFREHNPNATIEVSTNGSARNAEFWQELGQIPGILTRFCIDGIGDTHKLYRQDTDYHKILENAKIYIEAGGHATWKMIIFDHNKHQVPFANQLSKDLGFRQFITVDQGRNVGPVFDRSGNLVNVLGNYTTPVRDVSQPLSWIKSQNWDHVVNEDPGVQLRCTTKQDKSIYISADAKVYPCCFLGFNPESYESGWLGFVNKQIKTYISNNSLLENDLATCLEWFQRVEDSWNIDKYSDGRCRLCDHSCKIQ